MFGINGLEGIVLLIMAALLFGDRLPEYSQKLGQWVRDLRRMSEEAKNRLKEEVPEIQDVDWRKMDPRQYDPRKIIKDALLEDTVLADSSPNGGSHAAGALEGDSAGDPSGPGGSPSSQGSDLHKSAPAPVRPFRSLEAGEDAPFDTEAT